MKKNKQKKYLRSIISSLIILSVFLMPISYLGNIQKANAQNSGYTPISGGATGGGGLTGYVSGLAPAIAQLPLCTKALTSGISSLFSGGGDISSLAGDQSNLSNLSDLGTDATEQTMAVRTYSTTTNNYLGKIATNTASTAKSTSSTNTNDTCLKSIGRLVIKQLIQKLTLSIVDWINNGFNGGPAFIQDPKRFFGEIAKNEILQFGLEINDPNLFPFGKAFMQNTAMAFNRKFANTAQYSLDKLVKETNPQFSGAGFIADFSQGGWTAFDALTRIPANNSMGFNIMASNELQSRVEGTFKSPAQLTNEALMQANGFLGDQRCTDPWGTTKEQSDAARKAGQTDQICKQWQYVTPGQMIAHAAIGVSDYQKDSLIKAQDLNDAVAAIIDALLSQFSNKIMTEGFANLSNEGADGSFIPDNTNMGNNYSTSQTNKDFSSFQINASSWLQQNPEFNIRTDLNQALIDAQRTYVDKITSENTELMSTTNGQPYSAPYGSGSSNAYGLIPAINQLDYCIPGPHPGWENDSRQLLNDAEDKKVLSLTAQDFLSQDLLSDLITSSIPIIGSLMSQQKQADAIAAVKDYYQNKLRSFTEMEEDTSQTDKRILTNKGSLVVILNTIFDSYVKAINTVYSDNIKPNVFKEAETEYNKIQGYQKMMDSNETKKAALNGAITRLEQIKIQIDTLNGQLANGSLDPDPVKAQVIYENDLAPYISSFARISTDLVSGDDIAKVDNILKQIKDEKDYVYNDLLKGPQGCEAQLTGGLPWPLNDIKRMPYRGVIVYDYNNLSPGSTIPDPWRHKYSNKMPSNSPCYGPGFLSYAGFTNSYSGCSSATSCNIFVDIPLGNSTATSVGKSPQNDANKAGVCGAGNSRGMQNHTDGIFEQVIGIY